MLESSPDPGLSEADWVQVSEVILEIEAVVLVRERSMIEMIVVFPLKKACHMRHQGIRSCYVGKVIVHLSSFDELSE